MLESVVISVVPLYTLQNSQPSYGLLNSFWEAGAVCYTIVIVIVNAKVSIACADMFSDEVIDVLDTLLAKQLAQGSHRTTPPVLLHVVRCGILHYEHHLDRFRLV